MKQSSVAATETTDPLIELYTRASSTFQAARDQGMVAGYDAVASLREHGRYHCGEEGRAGAVAP